MDYLTRCGIPQTLSVEHRRMDFHNTLIVLWRLRSKACSDLERAFFLVEVFVKGGRRTWHACIRKNASIHI